MRWVYVGVVSLMVVLAGCGGFFGGETGEEQTPGQMAEDPPDPDEDVIGWEQGYWYNESIAIDQEGSLSPQERRALVARTMARVERIRQLEFRSEVPTTVISRSRFTQARQTQNTSDALRAFINAKFEALFMINESTDAVEVRRQASSSVVTGLYTPAQDRIVLIETGGATRIEEATLAHELTHALQDQHFNLSTFERPTREEHNAVDGLVEGDANLVQHLYEQRCEGVWNGSCATSPPRKAQGGAGTLENIGPYILRYQPYSDGPAFIRQMRTQGGWEQVNDLYDDPPTSTEQTIHPELYGEDQPATVRIEDRSASTWNRLQVPGRPNYAEVGEAGLASMLTRPALATQGQVQVVSARSFFTDDELDPYNYSNRYTSGWDGDRLAVYTSQQTPPSESGYVYKTVWDSASQAQEFFKGYRQLLTIEGARPVDGRSNTWRIPEGTGFGDVYFVRIQGDTVTIVNGPTIEALSEIYRGADSRSDNRTTG